MYDVIIIGGGVIGCSIARELSKYQLKIAVLEKASDVCEGTSKANSGLCHAGYDAKNNTLKAKLNVRGSVLMPALSEELGFLYKRNKALVVCFDEKDIVKLEELKERGEKNNVEGLEIISGEEVRRMEPNLSENIKAALYAPTAALVDPFGLTHAMADNAVLNKAEFFLNTEVVGIGRVSDCYEIKAKSLNKDVAFETKTIINAAGVYADRIHNMVSENKIEITARRGEYMLLDTTACDFTQMTVFQVPSDLGKGILITPTTHGNYLVGPTATDIDDKEDTQTTANETERIKAVSSLSSSKVPFGEVITSFAGLRARLTQRADVINNEPEEYMNLEGDFMIGELREAPGFIDVAGIESPGLSSAPAIAEYVAELLGKITELKKKDDFIPENSPKFRFALSTDEEKAAAIKENPLYGNIICRCRMVTEGEILDAIHSPLGATTADGIKRRTTASMGRCQAGFCNPKIVEILARELGVEADEITKNDKGSEFLSPEH